RPRATRCIRGYECGVVPERGVGLEDLRDLRARCLELIRAGLSNRERQLDTMRAFGMASERAELRIEIFGTLESSAFECLGVLFGGGFQLFERMDLVLDLLAIPSSRCDNILCVDGWSPLR